MADLTNMDDDLLELLLVTDSIEKLKHLEMFITESNEIEGIFSKGQVKYSQKAYNITKEITPKSILKMHKIIIENLNKPIAGKFRDKVVYIGGRICPTDYLDDRIRDLCEVVPRDGLSALNWHINFEIIHPFLDGNGRTGRLIYYWHCQNIGIEPMMFLAKYKKGYYGLFRGL